VKRSIINHGLMRNIQNWLFQGSRLQWLQDPSEVNDGNLSNVRWEASRHFRNKKREYLKDKINESESNRKNKNIKCIGA
jgi:hypothetical protein